MPNTHQLLIVFNKPIRLGPSVARGRNVSAYGTDIDPGCIIGSGARFIKLAPHSVDLVIDTKSGAVFFVDGNKRKCLIDQDDVDMIKEVENNRIIWTSPKAAQIVIELDPAARTKPQLTRLPNGGPAILYFDKQNCIPQSRTDGLDLKNFPGFVKLHVGVMFRELDAKRLEFEFLGDVFPLEKFYVLQVYNKNGGRILWKK